MHRRQTRLKQANRRLPPHVTPLFIERLTSLLDEDPSIEAKYLKKFFLTKFTDSSVTSAEERRSRAITKWLAVEERNRLFNKQISSDPYENGHALCGCDWTLKELLDKAREIVASILPSSPSLDIAYAGYSGGASTSKKRQDGHPAVKFRDRADSTRYAWQVCRDLFRGTRYGKSIDSGLEPRFVRGSILFTVPKNSDVDRVACKEPDINVFLQKMFGNQIRTCLRRVGINLNDQTINGELAREGSITGLLATLDLSSASDSVTHGLVRRLLPDDWYYWLNTVRSHVIDIDGRTHRLNMFSSMGNGFTFELESLLFYSLLRSVAYATGIRGRISVYGDDLIVPVELAPFAIQLLGLVGFSTNAEKSFVEGPFRESCGAYWHNGINVKPFYIKGALHRYTDLIKVLNALTAWSSRVLHVVDPQYEAMMMEFWNFIPPKFWGGSDLTSITSLVTGDNPRSELVEVKEELDCSHNGGYLHWMQTTALRQDHRSVSVRGVLSTGLYRSKRAKRGDRDIPIFLSIYSRGDGVIHGAPHA